jgi:hypothetical protein
MLKEPRSKIGSMVIDQGNRCVERIMDLQELSVIDEHSVAVLERGELTGFAVGAWLLRFAR